MSRKPTVDALSRLSESKIKQLEEARKVFFAKKKIVKGNRPGQMQLIDVYYEYLTQESMRGEPNAIKELRLLRAHKDKQYALTSRTSSKAESRAGALQKKHKPIADIGNLIAGYIYFRLLQEVIEAFERVCGPLKNPYSVVPYYLDLSPWRDNFEKLRRKVRKHRPKGDYEVGYGKPPEATRFTKSGNPSGKPKARSPWDGLEQTALSEILVTKSDGTRVRTTKLAVTYNQLFRDAMSGNSGARAEIRHLLISLDVNGLLTPPPKVRRTRPSAEALALFRTVVKATEVMAAPKLKRDLVNAFARRYDCQIPEFTTEYERSLPTLKEVLGLDALLARRKQPELATTEGGCDD